MIDFTTVSREFLGLVDRRRELFTFLGSAFAALGLFLHNTLGGGLPASLAGIQDRIFTAYAFTLMVISLLLALRMAKLHGGMVLNGILFARLMQEQTFTRKGDPQRAARHNWFGVSFLQFVLVDLIASFSAAILALALGLHTAAAVALGGLVFVLWLGFYFTTRAGAAAFALHKAGSDACGTFERNEWEHHLSSSLQQANQGLIGEIAFAGLMVFSGFGALSSLGKVQASAEFTTEDIAAHGPLVYALLMVVTCLFELVIYCRIRVAIGTFCLQLDPTDRPFRPLRLTDSFLGYALLAFLFAVSVHVLLAVAVPALQDRWPLLLAIDAAAFAAALALEQLTLVAAGRKA
jgi:hypothetical protein